LQDKSTPTAQHTYRCAQWRTGKLSYIWKNKITIDTCA